MSIAKYIKNRDDSGIIINNDLINTWESVLPDLVANYSDTTTTIGVSVADKYIFDFYGLLDSLGVPERFRYPNMRANGLKSSDDYRGKITNVVLLDASRLDIVYKSITAKK